LEPHGEHVAPAVPHEVSPSDAHGSQVPFAPPLQQPFGHEVASHTHWPLFLSHSRPLLQAAQVAPLAPQTAPSLVRGVHVPVVVQQPLQEPPPHAQTPLVQASPPAHGWQDPPLVPHDRGPCPAYSSHAPPAVQHPLAQEVELHTHWPAEPHVSPLVPPAVQSIHAAPPVPHDGPDCAV